MDMTTESTPMFNGAQIAADRAAANPMHAAATVSIAWIDHSQLTRESLISALVGSHPEFSISAFASVPECLGQRGLDADIILFYCHSEDHVDLDGIQALRDSFPETPLIVMSDATLCDPQTVRETLGRGVAGFILTRRTGLQVVASAINLVHSGGTFVPRDFLFTQAPAPAIATTRKGEARHLTQRELAVLELIRLGKPNKVIAEDLGMSASTVKVHVRNIMQKMGVSNRTQVALSAQRFDGS
ncbi:helix-turn-helix transcriptional regulator [Acidisoma sp. C75]